MSGTRIFCSAAALSSLITLPALAQTPVSILGDDLDTILVTGTRFETPLDQIGRSVSVLTAQDINIRQQRFAFDALRAVPGVQLIQSGSFGSLSSVSIRGLPSGQTLVVQDGVVQNNPASFANSFNFANFDTADIERIEVLRGAQSTLYGSDAIGGVINIVTRDGREGLGGDAFIEAGSFGTVRGAASILGGSDRASGRLTISGINSRGFSTADAANGNTERDGFENITVSSKGRFEATDSLVFDGVLRYQKSENEFDGFDFANGAADADEVGDTEELSLAAFATHTAFSGALESRLSVSYLSNSQVTLSSGVPTFDADGTRFSAEYQGTVRPAEWVTLILGAEYDKQKSEVAVGFGGNQNIETISGFGLLQVEPVEGLTLNAGLRHDASPDVSDETTFSVSGVYKIAPTGTLVRASYAEGFRAPTAGELSFNPDLFAEFSTGWDIGLEQPFLDGNARISVTYFDQDIDDLIAFDLAAFTFVNIQEFSSKGVEVALDVIVNDWLSVNTAYTYIDAINLSTNIAAGNQPDHRITTEIAVQPTDKLSLSLGASYNGEERTSSAVLDDFVLVNLRGSYALDDRIDVFARIENLTDANYQDNFGYGTAPFSVFGGIRARF